MVNLSISAQLVATLKATGVDFFVSVPCKLLAGQIRLLEQDTEICYLPVTREEEGFGLCAGTGLGEVSEDKGAKQIVSHLRSWVNAPSLNRFSGLWLLNYAPGWPTPRRTSDAARPRPSATRPYREGRRTTRF